LKKNCGVPGVHLTKGGGPIRKKGRQKVVWVRRHGRTRTRGKRVSFVCKEKRGWNSARKEGKKDISPRKRGNLYIDDPFNYNVLERGKGKGDTGCYSRRKGERNM